MMPTFLSGFLLSLSLIIAIGAQNAFVLRQGLRGRHVFAVCLFCGLSDALLIGAGVIGFGQLASQWPWFEAAMRYGGAAFLIWYGWLNAQSAWRGGAVLETGEQDEKGLAATLAILAGITWLNPHVYLDTVVLIGSIASQYEDRIAFGGGAILGSLVFFFCLGYGARLLTPVFQKPRAWQYLDAGIALTMWAIAVGLLLG